jgi:hypothetical protein
MSLTRTEIKQLVAIKRRQIVLPPCDLPPPPNTIPESLTHHFTMNGKLKILYRYYDGRRWKAVHNTQTKYVEIFRQLSSGKFDYYDQEGKAFFDVIHLYSLYGKKVLIWGLADCNCDALAIWAGAEKIFVVDYNKPICDHKKITVFNHAELDAAGVVTDFAISYSSFEHDGLGRYGEPIQPNGDIQAMYNARKFLKDDGILLLGVPLGQDCLVWNAHRIYGKYRLPLLLQGWKLLDVFDSYYGQSEEYPFDLPVGIHRQSILVLKKICTQYADDDHLITKRQKTTEKLSTIAQDIYTRINTFIFNFKYNIKL